MNPLRHSGCTDSVGTLENLRTHDNTIHTVNDSHTIQGNCVTCDDAYDSDGRPVGDREYFAVIRGAMKVLNFTAEEMDNIWSIVATVLHLGNIVFQGMYVDTEYMYMHTHTLRRVLIWMKSELG